MIVLSKRAFLQRIALNAIKLSCLNMKINGKGIHICTLHLGVINLRSINLNKTSATTNLGNGNTQTATATFTRTDDTTGTAANLGLVNNTFYRKFTNRVTLTDTAKKLPEVSGSGRVRNLREAISRYSALNEFRLPPGGGNGGFIAGAKHTWGSP